MSSLRVKSADCSGEELFKIAKRCGFRDGRGKKHYKITTISGKFITMIPRHPRVKKELVKSIIQAFNKFGGKIEIT